MDSWMGLNLFINIMHILLLLLFICAAYIKVRVRYACCAKAIQGSNR